MAMTTQNKWIIGIVSFLGLAVLTKKYWMPKPDDSKTNSVKKNTDTIVEKPKTDNVTSGNKKYKLKDIGFPAAMLWNGGQDFTQTSIMPSEMPFTLTGKEMTAYNILLAETSVLNKGKSIWVNKTALQAV